jgi:hypothetical protein
VDGAEVIAAIQQDFADNIQVTHRQLNVKPDLNNTREFLLRLPHEVKN